MENKLLTPGSVYEVECDREINGEHAYIATDYDFQPGDVLMVVSDDGENVVAQDINGDEWAFDREEFVATTKKID